MHPCFHVSSSLNSCSVECFWCNRLNHIRYYRLTTNQKRGFPMTMVHPEIQEKYSTPHRVGLEMGLTRKQRSPGECPAESGHPSPSYWSWRAAAWSWKIHNIHVSVFPLRRTKNNGTRTRVSQNTAHLGSVYTHLFFLAFLRWENLVLYLPSLVQGSQWAESGVNMWHMWQYWLLIGPYWQGRPEQRPPAQQLDWRALREVSVLTELSQKYRRDITKCPELRHWKLLRRYTREAEGGQENTRGVLHQPR